MDRRGGVARRLTEPRRRLARERAEVHLVAVRPQDVGDDLDDRRLSAARAAVDDGEAVVLDRGADGVHLALVRREGGLDLRRVEGYVGRLRLVRDVAGDVALAADHLVQGDVLESDELDAALRDDARERDLSRRPVHVEAIHRIVEGVAADDRAPGLVEERAHRVVHGDNGASEVSLADPEALAHPLVHGLEADARERREDVRVRLDRRDRLVLPLLPRLVRHADCAAVLEDERDALGLVLVRVEGSEGTLEGDPDLLRHLVEMVAPGFAILRPQPVAGRGADALRHLRRVVEERARVHRDVVRHLREVELEHPVPHGLRARELEDHPGLRPERDLAEAGIGLRPHDNLVERPVLGELLLRPCDTGHDDVNGFDLHFYLMRSFGKTRPPSWTARFARMLKASPAAQEASPANSTEAR